MGLNTKILANCLFATTFFGYLSSSFAGATGEFLSQNDSRFSENASSQSIEVEQVVSGINVTVDGKESGWDQVQQSDAYNDVSFAKFGEQFLGEVSSTELDKNSSEYVDGAENSEASSDLLVKSDTNGEKRIYTSGEVQTESNQYNMAQNIVLAGGGMAAILYAFYYFILKKGSQLPTMTAGSQEEDSLLNPVEPENRSRILQILTKILYGVFGIAFFVSMGWSLFCDENN